MVIDNRRIYKRKSGEKIRFNNREFTGGVYKRGIDKGVKSRL